MGWGAVDLEDWFGPSCVVDASGEPRMVFHGTGSDVGPILRPLTFFTANPEIAQIYACAPTRQVDGSGPNIVPSYLRILHPYIHDDQAVGENLSHAVLGRRGSHQQVMEALVERGHDGILLKNYYDLGGMQDQWVIFDGAQAMPIWCVNPRAELQERAQHCRPRPG